MKVLFLFLVLVSLITSGCSFGNRGDSVSENNFGIMPDSFWGKGEKSDLPWAFETVCIEKLPGTDLEKCGSTHFDLDGYMVVVDYTLFENEQATKEAFDKAVMSAKIILRRGESTYLSGGKQGEKTLLKRVNHEGNLYYSLLWTRGTRLAEVSCESRTALEKYEADRKL